MAAHGFSCCSRNRTGSREWECEIRSGYCSNGAGLVRVCAVDHCDDRSIGDDIEYSSVEEVG